MVQPGARGTWRARHLAGACLSGAILIAATAPVRAAPLEVTVTGVRNSKGEVRLAVCTQAAFLRPTCEHVARAPARAGDVVLRLDVPPGTWAAQAFHDEDGNGAITTSLLGIPEEGIGFSNDVRFRFGPPGFDAAAFRLGLAGGRIHFALRYQF